MAKGRTIFERLTGSNLPVPVELQYHNPLGAKIGSQVQVDTIDHERELWQVREIWAWDQTINDNHHQFADYVLTSPGSDTNLVIRVLPRQKACVGTKLDKAILILTQYYPDDPGPMSYSDDAQLVIDALDIQDGEFYRYRDTEQEEKYWRVAGKIPIYCKVSVIADWNGDGKIDESEARTSTYTIWDYSRTTKDEAGTEFTQFLYGQLNGRYDPKSKKITSGDKTLLLLRGEEVDPTKVMVW